MELLVVVETATRWQHINDGVITISGFSYSLSIAPSCCVVRSKTSFSF